MQTSKRLPSEKWKSFDVWGYNGMDLRLQKALDTIDKAALVRHAERIKGGKVTMSAPFSAGEYWICFEMVAEQDGSLIIARVRLPRHPDLPPTVTEEDEAYSIACEVNSMQFVKQKLPDIPIPTVYAYEGPDSQLAADAGAMYMLLEGFYGNTLVDVEFDMTFLPAATQEHIMEQWTRIQTRLATLKYPQIGAISSISESGEPVIGRLPVASNDVELGNTGPFASAVDYFTAVANAAIHRHEPYSQAKLGAIVFRNIVKYTTLFGGEGGKDTGSDDGGEQLFPLNHMDLGTQNILVDDEFNIIAVIDWEFTQTAPWQVNNYPMPFPMTTMDIEEKIHDPNHIAYENVLRQDTSRNMYRQKFHDAEQHVVLDTASSLNGSFASTLSSTASRVFACFSDLGNMPEVDAELSRDMVRLAFDLETDTAERYAQQADLFPGYQWSRHASLDHKCSTLGEETTKPSAP